MFGVYDPHADEMYVECYEKKTSEEYIDFVLNRVRKKYPYVTLHIIEDNASIHTSKKSSEAIGRHRRINRVRLPTSSPKLNLIESR